MFYDGYQTFLVFALMLSCLISDSISKVTNCISTRISSEKIKQFDTDIEPTVTNLAYGGVNLKFNNSVLVKKVFLHCTVTLFQNYT